MKKILVISLINFIFLSCNKEYECEGFPEEPSLKFQFVYDMDKIYSGYNIDSSNLNDVQIQSIKT